MCLFCTMALSFISSALFNICCCCFSFSFFFNLLHFSAFHFFSNALAFPLSAFTCHFQQKMQYLGVSDTSSEIAMFLRHMNVAMYSCLQLACWTRWILTFSLRNIAAINIRQKKLKCKFSFYSDFILQQKLCKAFRRHFPHIRAIFKTLCMASATKYSFKNINNLVMLVHARL